MFSFKKSLYTLANLMDKNNYLLNKPLRQPARQNSEQQILRAGIEGWDADYP